MLSISFGALDSSSYTPAGYSKSHSDYHSKPITMDKKTALIDSQILNTIAFGCFAFYHFNQETTALYVGAFMAALALIWITIALFHLKEIKLGTEGYGNVFVVSIFCNLIFSILYLIIFFLVP